MIMNTKQKKIKIELSIKLNYSVQQVHDGRVGQKLLDREKLN